MSEKKGFTLVELLVVIAIIALLMAILMPALNRVKKQAKSAACKVNLRQWSLIWKIYCDDNDDRFPNPSTENWKRGTWVLALRDKWHTQSDILRCPMAVKPPFNDPSYQYGGPFNTYRMGGPASVREAKCSYGMNVWAYSPGPDDVAAGYIQGRPVEWHWKTPTHRKASEVPLFADTMWRGGGPTSGDPAETVSGQLEIERSFPPDYNGEWTQDGKLKPYKYEMKHFCIDRHNARINMLFMDWHVREVGLKELWTLKWHKNFNTAYGWTKAGGVRPDEWPPWMRKFKDY